MWRFTPSGTLWHTWDFTRLHFSTIKVMLGHVCDVLYKQEGFDPDNDKDIPNQRDYDAEEDIAVYQLGGGGFLDPSLQTNTRIEVMDICVSLLDVSANHPFVTLSIHLQQ
jgi:hypothetical protein